MLKSMSVFSLLFKCMFYYASDVSSKTSDINQHESFTMCRCLVPAGHLFIIQQTTKLHDKEYIVKE